jgi:SAM-dependent methyltransferase
LGWVAVDGPQARGSALTRLLGWPVRRLLDPRVRWTASLVADRLDDRVGALQRHIEQAEVRLEDQGRGLHEKLAALRVDELLARGPGTTAELTDELGRFLNWAEGHQGYAAQAELWFNPPVALDYRPGRVEPRQISERIVEPPFVFAALARLDPPARVLDVGGSESTVALSLAALGHDVTVVDPRGYPIAHPRLRAAACRLDELDPDLTGFDAAVALSAIEHFGLGAYDAAGAGGGGRLDLAALDELRRHRLRPGGILALTVPFGEPRVDDFERVYDAAGLSELLAGWRVDRARAAWQVDRLTWVAGELDEPLAARGVALVLARAAADAD